MSYFSSPDTAGQSRPDYQRWSHTLFNAIEDIQDEIEDISFTERSVGRLPDVVKNLLSLAREIRNTR